MEDRGIPKRPSTSEVLKGTTIYKMLEGLLGAATLPGDVYSGKVNPMSDEAIGRSTDLAGAVMGGSFPASKGLLGAGETALGAGMVIPGNKVVKGYHGTSSAADFAKPTGSHDFGTFFGSNPKIAEYYANLEGHIKDLPHLAEMRDSFRSELSPRIYPNYINTGNKSLVMDADPLNILQTFGDKNGMLNTLGAVQNKSGTWGVGSKVDPNIKGLLGDLTDEFNHGLKYGGGYDEESVVGARELYKIFSSHDIGSIMYPHQQGGVAGNVIVSTLPDNITTTIGSNAPKGLLTDSQLDHIIRGVR